MIREVCTSKGRTIGEPGIDIYIYLCIQLRCFENEQGNYSFKCNYIF